MATFTEMCRTGASTLPYRLKYDHRSMTAYIFPKTGSSETLGEIVFPSTDLPEVRDRLFAELDAAVRSKLAAMIGTTPDDLDASLALAQEHYYARGMVIFTHWVDLHPERRLELAVEMWRFTGNIWG